MVNPYQVSNSFNAEQLRLYAKIHKMHGKLEAQLVAGGES